MESCVKPLALVILRGALGDTLLAWPALSQLPARLKVTGLTLAGHPAYLSLFKTQSLVDSIWDQSGSDWAGLYMDAPRATPRLQALLDKHAVAVVLAKRLPDPAAQGLAALGLPEVLTVPSWPKEASDEHVAWRMCRRLGVKAPFAPPPITPSNEGLAAARIFLEARGMDREPLVVLHPGSGGRSKNWPLSNWLAAAHRMADGYRILFLAGPAEEEIIERLTGDLPPSAVTAVNLPLPTVAGLIHLCQGYVGHDSGVSHLAAMMDRPVLALFGPTNPNHWRPLGPNVNLITPPPDWPDRTDWRWLDVDTVVRSILQMMDHG